ncbi:MAG: MFS transporter, partial [Porticoccaceae bacterium]|nr:MFS transporter [Porticoccaceae bacterium]
WNFMFIGATQLVTQTYTPAEKAKTQAANEFLIFSMVTVASLGAGWMEAELGWATTSLLMLPLVLWAMLVLAWFGRKTVRAEEEAASP